MCAMPIVDPKELVAGCAWACAERPVRLTAAAVAVVAQRRCIDRCKQSAAPPLVTLIGVARFVRRTSIIAESDIARRDDGAQSEQRNRSEGDPTLPSIYGEADTADRRTRDVVAFAFACCVLRRAAKVPSASHCASSQTGKQCSHDHHGWCNCMETKVRDANLAHQSRVGEELRGRRQSESAQRSERSHSFVSLCSLLHRAHTLATNTAQRNTPAQTISSPSPHPARSTASAFLS